MNPRPTRGPPTAQSGRIRTLPFDAMGPTEAFDADAAIAQVRAAIALERRAARRPVDVRVDAVAPVDAEAGLWRLRVTLPPGQRLQHWEGAFLFRALAAQGPAWAGEVVLADLRGGALVVECAPGEQPAPGLVLARPMDFLRAPTQLLESPRLAGVLPAYGRLLGLSTGDLTPPDGIHDLPGLAPWGGHPAWTHGWAMVWGPPGTGKTHAIVKAVQRLLARPDERVLVLATTHKATDEVALRLGAAAQNASLMRVGAGDVAAFVRQGLERLLPDGGVGSAALAAAARRVQRATSFEARARAAWERARLQRGQPRLRDLLADDHPRCVLATLHAGLQAVTSPDMDLFHEHNRAPFTTVIIDEAGMVPRATAAAVGLLAAHQVVLVGDPKQLSPICIAARSMEPRVKRWLGWSGMEHASLRNDATESLMQQRRMHPDISRVVSGFQYGFRLQDHPRVATRPLPEGFGRLARWPRAAWVVLDACEGLSEANVGADRDLNRSRVRRAGIDIFGRLLSRYPELRRAQGLFISPYRGQAQAASDLLADQGCDDTWAASTVHAQQGSEAEVVVFDLVCHGGWGEPEWRRLVNVAMSRAQYQLVFMAAANELDQAWLARLHEALTACVVSASGALTKRGADDAQRGLFATSVDAVSRVGGEGPAHAAPSGAAEPHPGPYLHAPRDDGASLGSQIRHSRAARRSLTRAQATLVRRDLADLGPRVVRGVAGSGKTIVLARWAALELHRHDRDATVVFGNTALRPHLRGLLAQAWRVTVDDPRAEPPWDRIHLVHIGALLRQLRVEAGLPPPPDSEQFELDRLAAALMHEDLPARFGLLYVDEAQDLGHETLRLLVSLVQPEPDDGGAEQRPVRIFYDNAQNIYRRSTPRWAEFGLDMRGRSTVLRESFRSTRPAMEFALDLLHQLSPIDHDPDFKELMEPRTGPPLLFSRPNGTWQADFCVVQGQDPEVVLHDRRADEAVALVARVQSWIDLGVAPRDIRVLAPSRARCDAAADALHQAGVPVNVARNSAFEPGDRRVIVTTPQSFKGYEAELVAVIGLDGFCTRGGVLLTQALYVALTRARTWMWVSGTRVAPGVPSGAIIAAAERAVALRPERVAVS